MLVSGGPDFRQKKDSVEGRSRMTGRSMAGLLAGSVIKKSHGCAVLQRERQRLVEGQRLARGPFGSKFCFAQPG